MDKLNEILQYVLKGECIIFIGAGLSKIAGCYDWDSIVKEMLVHEVVKNKINITELDQSQFSNEEVIDFCQREFDRAGKEDDFWGIVRKALIKDPKKFNEVYIPLIKGISKITPFPRIVITTNIDSCLEETQLFPLNKVFYEPCDFNIQKLNGSGIFHIHGYVENLKKCLLTKRRYIERYKENGFNNFLDKLFSDYSTLFLGYSLRDSEIKNILMRAQNKKKHFALVSNDDGFTSSELTIFSDLYKTKIIVYGERDTFQNQLIDWIAKNFFRKD